MMDLQKRTYAMSLGDNAAKIQEELAEDEALLGELVALKNRLASDPVSEKLGLIPAGDCWILEPNGGRLALTYSVLEEESRVLIHHIAVRHLPLERLVFISYAHQDHELKEQLMPYLRALERAGLLKFWDDSKIKSGMEWRQEIEKALQESRATLLLVSQAFFDSDFITPVELTTLLESAAQDSAFKVFWIHLRPSMVFTECPAITKYQALLDPSETLIELEGGKRERAMVNMIENLKEALD